MTFKELQNKNKYGILVEADWHQHKNGGAWIYKDAHIDEKIFISDQAVVWGGVISGGEIMGGEIWGGVISGGEISGGEIRGGEIMGGEIRGGEIMGGEIWGGVIMGGEIWGGEIWGGVIRGGEIMGGVIRGGVIRGGVIWGGIIRGGIIRGGEIRGGEIWGGEWKVQPLFIQGSKWSLSNAKPGHLQIGCECHEFGWWKKNGVKLAKDHGFTEEQIKEYTAYVALFCKFGK